MTVFVTWYEPRPSEGIDVVEHEGGYKQLKQIWFLSTFRLFLST